ncbi:MAG TPA: T9SS type A sorting domain-containing protein, partial [Chitinophagaceae bacterium]|nr:T9SS type A sorting domain-containing protein [Chitinophagaceae bacterium]
TTFAGTGTEGNTGDGGLPIHAQLGQPGDVHFDNQNNIYIPDFSYGVVRKINAMTGVITTIAGDGTWGYSGDGGPATDAELSCVDLAFDSYGDMIIDDYGTNTIRMVYNPQLGVSNNNPQDMVKVYPNPATNELNVTGLQENTGYRLLSITGASMQQGILQQGSNTIAMKNFASGIYILEMTNADGQQNTVRVFKD